MLDEAARLYPRMTRIFIHPDWVGILDFETRLPSAVERAIERAQAGARESFSGHPATIGGNMRSDLVSLLLDVVEVSLRSSLRVL